MNDTHSADNAPRSYAPNYDVPENVSPFVPLPLLALCSSCREPVEPLQLWCVLHDGQLLLDLCRPCADRLYTPVQEDPCNS